MDYDYSLQGVFHKIFGGGGGTCCRLWFLVPVGDGVRWGGGLVSGTESDEGGLQGCDWALRKNPEK